MFQHDSEFSKNHTDDQESVVKCGQILFLNLLKVSDEDHFNPGQFLEEARQLYSPETKDGDRLFVKANLSSKFDVRNPANKVFFLCNCSLGKNKICLFGFLFIHINEIIDTRDCFYFLPNP